MSSSEIRPMTPHDVPEATSMVLQANWGDRRPWFEFATSQPECSPFVAVAGDALVGTGVATANGSVGWVGTIFVAPAHRLCGVGTALTHAVIHDLEARGCRTLLLVATDAGRPLYERLGFEVQTRYRILETPGLAPADPEGPAAGREIAVRPFEPRDLPGMIELDAEATGEDRAHALRRFAEPASTFVLPSPAGGVDAFVVRASWGGGATIARDADAALRILEARRRRAGPDGRVRVGLVEANIDGLRRLDAEGLPPVWSAPRMIRGEPLCWRPNWIWGQFNHAMG
jgi:GNAT superfamily N-acetyltransferase